MREFNINKIDLGKLAREMRRYEQQWIAISMLNKIIASGSTYGETLKKVPNPEEVILFKVPPLNYSLSPHLNEI